METICMHIFCIIYYNCMYIYIYIYILCIYIYICVCNISVCVCVHLLHLYLQILCLRPPCEQICDATLPHSRLSLYSYIYAVSVPLLTYLYYLIILYLFTFKFFCHCLYLGTCPLPAKEISHPEVPGFVEVLPELGDIPGVKS